MKRTVIEHRFVEAIPAQLDEGVLYVSIKYTTAVHHCLCGCGSEVVTPLSPTDWEMTFNGETVSLHPSIGNWSFPCQSHYWIRNNRVLWDRSWSKEEISTGRAQDVIRKRGYYEGVSADAPNASVVKKRSALWSLLGKLFGK